MSRSIDGGGAVTITKQTVSDTGRLDSTQRTRIASAYTIWTSEVQCVDLGVPSSQSWRSNDVWEPIFEGKTAAQLTKLNGPVLYCEGSDSSMTLCARNYARCPGDGTVHTNIQFIYVPQTAVNNNPEITSISDGVTYKIGTTGLRYGGIQENVSLVITGAPTDALETLVLKHSLNPPAVLGDQTYVDPNASVSQSNWNIDRLDGTGPSKVNLLQRSGDKTYPYYTDGYFARGFTLVVSRFGGCLGNTRVGFQLDDVVYYVHEFSVARRNVYVSAFGPGATASFSQVTAPIVSVITNNQPPALGIFASIAVVRASIVSEGPLPVERPTYTRAFTNGAGLLSSGTGGTLKPIVSIRSADYGDQQAMYTGQLVTHSIQPTALSVYNSGASPLTVQLVLNASLSGANFQPVDPYSSCAASDVSATSRTTDGRIVMTGFVAPGTAASFDLTMTCGKRPIGITVYKRFNESYTLLAGTSAGVACPLLYALHWHEFH